MSRTHHHGWMKNKPWTKVPTGGYHWTAQTPSWWIRLYMNRPKRKADRALTRKVKAGHLDVDSATFSVGSRRPHVYYW